MVGWIRDCTLLIKTYTLYEKESKDRISKKSVTVTGEGSAQTSLLSVDWWIKCLKLFFVDLKLRLCLLYKWSKTGTKADCFTLVLYHFICRFNLWVLYSNVNIWSICTGTWYLSEDIWKYTELEGRHIIVKTLAVLLFNIIVYDYV